MAAQVQWDETSSDLFILRQLVHASRSFSESEKLRFGIPKENLDYDNIPTKTYLNNLKPQVLTRLLRSAINLRTIYDIVGHESNESSVTKLAEAASAGSKLFRNAQGMSADGIHDAWNLVIHSTWTSLVWTRIKNGREIQGIGWPEEVLPYFWSGWIVLLGQKHKVRWAIELNVEAFCKASAAFLEHDELAEAWSELSDNYD